MSYDLRVWCAEQPDEARLGTVARGKGWLVNATSVGCLPEDVPDEVAEQLPGIRHRVDLSLEPIDAPQAGRAAVWKVARSIAKSSHGVVEDPQEDSVELPSGVKRYTPIKHQSGARVSVLELSWWFDPARLLDTRAVERILDVLQRSLPEAMPRRYGLYEPPQHEYSVTGREHLVSFLVENLTGTGIVWYAHRPVLHVHMRVPGEPGWSMFRGSQTYRSSRIAIEIDAAALAQPGWQEGLSRAWRSISHELRPFFGDVRTLGGHIARGRSFWSDSDTEAHPVRSWFWHGVPPRLGHAAVIGEPYLSVWPELREHVECEEGLAFLAADSWRNGTDVADAIGGVPERLAIGFMARKKVLPTGGATTEWCEDYPPVFPFSRPGA